jgi:hypothetical protein
MFCFKQVMIGTSKNIWGFDPRSVPGCVVWLDSADTSTLTLSGSNITAWRDKSIYGNHVNTISPNPPTYNSADSSVNFSTTASNYMRGTMSQTYSNNATVFMIASVTSNAAVLGPRLWTLSTNAATDTATIGQFAFVIGNSANISTYLAIGTNPTGQGTNFTTYLSNSYNFDTRFMVTNTTTYSGTSYSIVTLLNGDTQTYSSNSGTKAADSYYVASYNKYTFSTAPVQVGDCFNGKIFEYLVFSRALTTAERQQIEGYLAWKWRLSGYSPITPLSISGCTLWLDASDASTITRSGSSITQWNDKSGTGNNMIPWTTFSNATVSSNFQNNLNVINFSANGVYQGLSSSGSYPVDVYLVMALKDTTTHADVITVHSSNSPSSFNSLTFGEYTASRWHNGSEGFARTPNCVSPSNETSTSFLLMNWSLSNSNYIVRRNGIQLVRTTSYTFSRPADSRFQIGFRVNPAAFSPGSTAGTFRGYIGEIVAYNSQLGDVQRQQIETYLGLKWGLNSVISRLPVTNPYFSIPPQLRVFQPRDITGCVLWLDGADTSTLTLSGSNITAWRDKSIFGNNVTQISTTAPTYNSTDSSINFVANSSTFLRGALSTSYSNASVFIVATFSSNPAPAFPRLSIISDSANSNSQLIGQLLVVYGNNPAVTVYLNSGSNPTGIGGINIMTYVSNATFGNKLLINNTTTRSGTAYTISTLLNGNTQVYSSNTGTIATSSGNVATYNKYTLGNYADASAAPGDAYNGKIFEYLIFNRVLTTEERQEVEGYLSMKWNLPQLNPAPTLPLTIPNCRLWLDATDTTTLTGSSPVTQWRDKSSNAYAFNGTGAVTSNFISSERPSLFFNGSSYFTNNSMSITNPFTVFTVGYQTSDNGSYYRILNGLSNTNYDYYLFVGCLGSNVATFIANGSSWNDVNANNPATRSLLSGTLICSTVSAGTITTYVNGTTLDTKSGNTTPTFTGLNIGGGYGTLTTLGAQSWNGHIGEIILYSGVLTTTQRQQVEGYLAKKWNILYNTLPSTHPFGTFPSSTVTRPNFLELPYTPANNNMFLAKYSSDGSVLWALRHVAPDGVIPRDMATDSSGNLYISTYYAGALTAYNINGTVATTKANAGSIDGYLAKYSSEGVLLWMARNAATAGNYGQGVAVDLSGNVYLGGLYQPSLTLYNPAETSNIQLTANTGITDGFLAKYSPDGNPLWVARTAGTSYDSGGLSVKTDSVGDVYSLGANVFAAVTFYNANGTTGGSLSFTGSTTEATWLAKWNSSGTFQWALRFVVNDTNTSIGSLSIDSNANLYLSFAYNATMTLRNTSDAVVATLSNAGSYDAFIASYTSAGAYRWHARIIGTGSSDLVAHTGSSNGDQYVLGWYTGTITIYTSGEASSNTLTNSGSYDVFLIKYSSAGVLQWSTRIGSVNNDVSYMPSVDPNGNVYVTGRYEGTCTFFNVGGGIAATLSNITSPDVFLAKYTTNGQLIWATRIAGTGADNEGAMVADRNGDVFVSGFYQSSPLTFYGV